MYKKDTSKRWMLLPQETTFSYKFHGAVNEAHGRPLITFALKDILFSEDYTEAQRGNMYENGNTIAYFQLPEGKDKGECSLNEQQQKQAYNSFKGAVNLARNKKNIGKTIPLKIPQGSSIGTLDVGDKFLKETLTDENNSNVSLGLGVSSSLFSCSGKAINYASLQTNLDLMLSEIYTMLDQFSLQYTKLINNYLGLKNGQELTFAYLHTSKINKDKEFKQYKELYTLAGGSRRFLYSVVSGNADLYMRMMEFEKEIGYDDDYLPHMTSYTMSDSADKQNPDGNMGGRPSKDVGDLTQGGITTRNDNSNNSVKPSTT